MPLRQTEVKPLLRDAASTLPMNGDARRFEWAMDHQIQEHPDWCWAACLSNALTCVGSYVKQEAIVHHFRRDHGAFPDPLGAQTIPTAKHVISLWRMHGYSEARFKDRPISFRTLSKEIAANGPVMIELWQDENDKRRHLVLIFGVGETKEGVAKVRVIDPHKDAGRPRWIPYREMRGENPLPESNFGKWQRTYFNLAYLRGYLRRFFGRPTEWLGKTDIVEEVVGPAGNVAPVLAQPQIAEEHASLLHFKTRLNPDHLAHELAFASYGYRYFRCSRATKEEAGQRLADLKQPLFLYESFEVWQPPSAIDYVSDLLPQLSLYGWQHQIHDDKGKPRYYSHSSFFDESSERADLGWRTRWMGERWAAPVDSAIAALDSNADLSQRDEEVRMVWFREHGLVTFLLKDRNVHVVVTAHADLQATFPALKVFTDEELRAALRNL